MSDIEDAAQLLDQVVLAHQLGQLTTQEAVRRLADLIQPLVDAPEFGLLYEYARHLVDTIAQPLRDLLLLDLFDELSAEADLVRAMGPRLELLLRELGIGISQGDGDAVTELVTLCRAGYRTHPLMLKPLGAPGKVLRLAHSLAVPEALVAAVSPRWPDAARLADETRTPKTWRLAWDLLAHLAADPASDSGADARDGLIHLCEFLETAGEAAIRLPVHLLNSRQRTDLLMCHETRAELVGDHAFLRSPSLYALRDARVLRASVWQAFDARHY